MQDRFTNFHLAVVIRSVNFLGMSETIRARTDIPARTAAFALQVINLYASLPKGMGAQAIGRQLFRSGTSVGAHVREGKHARSDAEMLSKVSVALQEMEETRYWIDLLCGARYVRREDIRELLSEADQLTAILFTSVRTLQGRIRGATRPADS